MKTRMIILVMALVAQSIAFSQPTTPFTSSTAVNGKKTTQFVNPFTQSPARIKNQPRFIEGLSTRPWAATVGWHPDKLISSDYEIHESHLNLIWFGSAPSQ